MARGVRRRHLPASKWGRRRIVLSGPTLPPSISMSGAQSCRRQEACGQVDSRSAPDHFPTGPTTTEAVNSSGTQTGQLHRHQNHTPPKTANTRGSRPSSTGCSVCRSSGARSARPLPWPGASAWCSTACGGMAPSSASRARRRWHSKRHRCGCIPSAVSKERRKEPRLKVAIHRCPLAGTRFPMMHAIRPVGRGAYGVRARSTDWHSGIVLDQAFSWQPPR